MPGRGQGTRDEGRSGETGGDPKAVLADQLGEPVAGSLPVCGGCQNRLLCQLTADLSGIPVTAGPVEATALGNVLVQARAHGAAPETLEEIRAGLARTEDLRRVRPS